MARFSDVANLPGVAVKTGARVRPSMANGKHPGSFGLGGIQVKKSGTLSFTEDFVAGTEISHVPSCLLIIVHDEHLIDCSSPVGIRVDCPFGLDGDDFVISI